MSTIAIITDSHFGVRSDTPAMYHTQQKFYEQGFFPALDAHGVTRMLHGGDYGDRRKYINFATARFIEHQYRAPLRSRGIREDVIIGNHDCFLRDSTEINSVEELYRHDDSLHIYTQPTELDVDGCGILLLPWICGNNREASMRAIATSSSAVVLGHLELSGFQMHRGMQNREGLDPSMFDRFGIVMSGHYHHRSAKDPIHYLGAPYAMTWADYRDPRGFHLFDTETYALTFIENPHTAFARLVYDDEEAPDDYAAGLVASVVAPESAYHEAYVKVVVKNKTRPYDFDLVLDALTKVNPQDVMIVDDIVNTLPDSEIDALSADVDTMTLMDDYVEGLSVSCDKAELQTYLRSLYHDAMMNTNSARLS